MGHDEVSLHRKQGGTFAAFDEAPLHFGPTYKFRFASVHKYHNIKENPNGKAPMKGGTEEHAWDHFNTSREPAFADRVLWRARAGVHVIPLVYERVDSIDLSDHRPVRLSLNVVAKQVCWAEVRRLCSEIREAEIVRIDSMQSVTSVMDYPVLSQRMSNQAWYGLVGAQDMCSLQ